MAIPTLLFPIRFLRILTENTYLIFTLEAPRQKGRNPKILGEYFFYCNASGRLSHANLHCQAKNFEHAIDIAKKNLDPFLSGWSVRFNIPLYIFRIRAMEESTDIVHSIFYHQFYPEIHTTLEDIIRGYWLPEDMRVFDFYREALNTTSPKYQFLCYYKVIELVLSLREKRDLQTRNKGKKHKRNIELFMEEEWFMPHLSDDLKPLVLGKKFTIIRNSVLRPIRNKIVHALMKNDDSYHLSDEEIFPYLPIAKLMAHQLLVAESHEQLTGITNGN